MSIELLGVALLAGVNALASGETLASCANDQHNGVSYAVCRFNQSDDIRLFLNDPDGAPYSDFDAVNEALSAVDKALVFAMNAGMYHEDRTPVGLYVEASEEIAPANTNDGPGNFHLKPNGIFIIDKHGAWVTTTTAYQASNRTPPIYATQSGPMLVIDGDIHPRFLPDSDSRKRRNGVGVTDGGDVVFVLADAPVNLYGFASYFREVLGARNALYLDGSISRLFAPELDRNDPGAAMGPIVGVVEKTTMKVVIDKRFCGPRQSGNGGYAAGLFAQVIDGPAAVMLKSPPPLETPIELRPSDRGRYEAIIGKKIIAVIEPADVSVETPPVPDDAAVAAARDSFLSDAGGEHLLPYCFVCGNKREVGDGLRIFAGPAPDSEINADFWTPSTDLADDDGLVRTEFLWAALDCPSAFALRNGLNLALLGRLAVDIRRRPEAGEALIAAAWRTGRDGRKHYSASALYDEMGDIIAVGGAVWIELKDPAFLEKLRMENA